MKHIALALMLTISVPAFASSEDVDYCKHKLAQVQIDTMSEDFCEFDEKTTGFMEQNLTNTYLNCSSILSDSQKMDVAQKAEAKLKAAMVLAGKEATCSAISLLYPYQISN